VPWSTRAAAQPRRECDHALAARRGAVETAAACGIIRPDEQYEPALVGKERRCCPGQQNKDGFDLYSFGPDGAEGGGDDIDNWSKQ
jgi:hypothetical protein